MYAEATDELVELAELLSIPVMSTLAGQERIFRNNIPWPWAAAPA